MGKYIDAELGIKSAKGLEKYLKERLQIDVRVHKLPNRTVIIYALSNKLYDEFISGSVIYVMQVEEVETAIANIKANIKLDTQF